MSPAPAVDPAQIANTVVTWSGFVLAGFGLLFTVFTALFVLAGVFGLREIRNIRQAGQDVSTRAAEILADANEQLVRLKSEVAGIDDRMNSMVEVAYLFNQGEVAYRDGEYAKAVDFLGRAATLDPRNARVLYRLGRSLTNLGDEVAAPDRFHEVREIGTHPGDAERGLALVYRYTNPGQALQYAVEASDVAPDNHRNWNCLGLLRRDDGDIAGALRAHERAATMDLDSPVTPFYLALLRASQGAHERAERDCRVAVYRLEQQDQRLAVKSLWAEMIRWADRIVVGDYDGADAHTRALADLCTSRRRAREVGGHMDFLLRSLGRENYRDRYIRLIENRWPPRPTE